MDNYFNKLDNLEGIESEFDFQDGIALPVPTSAHNLSGCQSSKLPGGFDFDDMVVLPILEQSPDSYSFSPLYDVSSELGFPDEHESYPVLRFIDQILMEEQPGNDCDLLALQAAEKSFYEVLGKDYPRSPRQLSAGFLHSSESSNGSTQISSQHTSINSSPTPTAGTSTDPPPILSWIQTSGELNQPPDSLKPLKNSSEKRDRQVDSFTNTGLISSTSCESETMLLFNRGFEEGNKFIPTTSEFQIDLGKYSSSSTALDSEAMVAEGENLVSGLRGRKHEYQDDSDAKDSGRSSKQSAVSVQGDELSETLDGLLLNGDARGRLSFGNIDVKLPTKVGKILEQNGSLRRIRAGKPKNPAKKPTGTSTKTLELSTLLMSCCQSVAAEDYRTANELLKQIRRHASCAGDAHQRLAFLCANALEARMAGTGAELYTALASKRLSSFEELRACRVYMCAPFRQIYYFFATKMILEAASKATVLHVVDFGINFGFQWPCLIQQLSNRPGGPPKLRITGIDFPEPGFRPAQRVEETGRRLEKYCGRFHVPFEYRGIALRNWETIRIEDLNFTRSELLAVSSQFVFKSLLDEMVDDESPRDAVLNLIRKMKPDIFLNDVLSGPLGSPFFVTRSREALNFFYTVFDMFDNNLRREDPHRLMLEQDFIGADVTNVIACEGLARVERLETYKQWQVRFERAGFRLLPLNQDFMKELRSKVKDGYHKNFVFDEDGYWILQGWKGKILTASSCWITA